MTDFKNNIADLEDNINENHKEVSRCFARFRVIKENGKLVFKGHNHLYDCIYPEKLLQSPIKEGQELLVTIIQTGS